MATVDALPPLTVPVDVHLDVPPASALLQSLAATLRARAAELDHLSRLAGGTPTELIAEQEGVPVMGGLLICPACGEGLRHDCGEANQ